MTAKKKQETLPILGGDFSIYGAPRIKGDPNPLANEREVQWFALAQNGGICNLGSEAERINIRLAGIFPENAPSYPDIKDEAAFEKYGLNAQRLARLPMRVVVKPVLLSAAQVEEILVSHAIEKLSHNEKKLVQDVYPQLSEYPELDLSVPAELKSAENDPTRFYPLDGMAYAVVDRQAYQDTASALWYQIGDGGRYRGLKPATIADYMSASADYISAFDLQDCGPKGDKLLLAIRYHAAFDRPVPYEETPEAREILARGIIAEKLPPREAKIALKKIKSAGTPEPK